MAKPKTKALPRKKKPTKRSKKQNSSSFLKGLILKASLLFIVILSAYVLYLDNIVRTQFEGKRWELPAHVFANPVEIYQGLPLSIQQFETLLGDLRYQRTTDFSSGGKYYQVQPLR